MHEHDREHPAPQGTRPDITLKVLYIDIRAYGGGFEDLYLRGRRPGVHYLRGLPGTVEELPDGVLRVMVENSAKGAIDTHDLDMLVLAVGIQPASSYLITGSLTEATPAQIVLDAFDSYFKERDPDLTWIKTTA